MSGGWIEHDGKGLPPGGIENVFEIWSRVVAPHDVLNWDWAGKTHRPEDVLRYRLKNKDGTVQRRSGIVEYAPHQQATLRASILDAARQAVLTDRAATHGALENSFGQLARVWSERVGVTITPAQVALMLVDLKVTRAWGNPGHQDNWVDIAGYAACGGEIAGGAA